MSLRNTPDIGAYARLIRQEPDEAVTLMKELLISVTNFFRDPAAWRALDEQVIPGLFARDRREEEIRVWVPGCATGEEAYSLGILLLEHASVRPERSLQVFATDLDIQAIAKAREGRYTEAEVADVSEERLQRFFVRDAGGFRIRRELRELMLFAHHDVIKDPPFSHLDLVTCRNLLIYLDHAIQARVLETFHFALRQGGCLFLGSSETPDAASGLFVPLDVPAHLYQARDAASRVAPPASRLPTLKPWLEPPPSPSRLTDRMAPADLHQRLLEEFAPPSVIVSDEHHVVHVSERAGRYMQIRGGELARDLLLLVLPELRPDLRIALYRAEKERTAVDVRGISVAIDGESRRVDLSVRPVLRESDPARGFFVVMFRESDPPFASAEPPVTLTSPAEAGTQQLDEELARVKSQLRTTIEQYEVQVEEAKASNEELQAMNEELRSAAEELETSKEELQSVNEELTTVNQELKIKIEELGSTNNDFQNYINATDVGTIFLDHMLRVKFSTPRARSVFNLQETDIGRPLSDFTTRLLYDTLGGDIQAVLDRLITVEREVESDDGRWHLVRVLPYRTRENRIDGVVVTLLDITERRAAEVRVRESEERMRALIDGALDYAIFTMREDGVIDSWNSGAERMFGYAADEIVGSHVEILFTPEDRVAGVPQKEIADARQTGRAADERVHVRKDGTRFYCSGVTRLVGAKRRQLAKIARDLTGERRAADNLQRLNDALETRVHERTADLERAIVEQESAKRTVTELLRRLVDAQEDERRRIARDLHDHLGQQVTALRLALERIEKPSANQTDRGVSQALEMTQEIGRTVDFLAWELRPAALDELGLGAALPRFVAEWSSHTGVRGEFRNNGFEAGQLPHDADVAFYRIVQEALNNVAKHAHASRVDILLTARDGQVVLVVEDDGVGFDPSDETAGGGGFGLAGMRERAALVDATVQIESAPGRGTAIFIRHKIERRSAAASEAG